MMEEDTMNPIFSWTVVQALRAEAEAEADAAARRAAARQAAARVTRSRRSLRGLAFAAAGTGPGHPGNIVRGIVRKAVEAL
jgi:hypothetical protein